MTAQQKSATGLSPQEVEELKEIADVLHLLHYRNRNQHRHARWWKQFNMFRREVRRIADLLAPESTEPELKGKAGLQLRKKLREQAERKKGMADARLRFWKEAGMVERCYIAFTHLTTSTRFSPVGLVALTCLATFCRITKITEAYEAEAQEQLHDFLAKFAKEEGEGLFGRNASVTEEGEHANEDLGECIVRDEAGISYDNKASDRHMPLEDQQSNGPAREQSSMSIDLGDSGRAIETIHAGKHSWSINEGSSSTPGTESVMREEPDLQKELSEQMAEEIGLTTNASSGAVLPKKRRKNGRANAIDDIFASV